MFRAEQTSLFAEDMSQSTTSETPNFLLFVDTPAMQCEPEDCHHEQTFRSTRDLLFARIASMLLSARKADPSRQKMRS